MSVTEFIPFLGRLADAASAAILPHFRTPFAIENKLSRGFDPVTVADRAAETAMRTLIRETYPDHGIVGEEFGAERADAERVWVLDPIDGTRAFIAGLPLWGILIGLSERGRPVLGMMAQPFTRERFVGDGLRAWYDGPGRRHQLRTRPVGDLSQAILSTTTPAQFVGPEAAAYGRVEAAVRLPRYGYDCYAFCMVAAGFIDVAVESGLQPYDIVPLIPLIEGAGGRVTSWTGTSAAGGGTVVATGDPRLHEQVLELLAE